MKPELSILSQFLSPLHKVNYLTSNDLSLESIAKTIDFAVFDSKCNQRAIDRHRQLGAKCKKSKAATQTIHLIHVFIKYKIYFIFTFSGTFRRETVPV